MPSTPAFEHHYAEVGEVMLHYVTLGSGPPVVLLHGWPQTWYEWRLVMPRLAERFTVIAPDLRGLGDSSRPLTGYDKRTVANDVWRLVTETLGHRTFHLVGHDWGGPTAYALAATHPEAVTKLAIVDVVIPGDGGDFSQGGRRWHHQFHITPDLPEALRGGLRVRRDNEMHTPVFPNGACVCEIEVDPETGGLDIVRYTTVDDVGRCINPLIVHGQTHGGIAQGVGQALWEQCHIDPSSGQPTSGSFMDYGMPRFDNMPSFKTQIVEVLSPTNPFGVKAGGEGGTTPAPAVIMSAIEDALSDCQPFELELPVTTLKVWSILQRASAEKRKSA